MNEIQVCVSVHLCAFSCHIIYNEFADFIFLVSQLHKSTSQFSLMPLKKRQSDLQFLREMNINFSEIRGMCFSTAVKSSFESCQARDQRQCSCIWKLHLQHQGNHVREELVFKLSRVQGDSPKNQSVTSCCHQATRH